MLVKISKDTQDSDIENTQKLVKILTSEIRKIHIRFQKLVKILISDLHES